MAATIQTFNAIDGRHFNPCLNYVYDTISGVFRPQQDTDFNSTQITGGVASTLSGSSNGVALPANPSRSVLFIQNLGINPLFVKFGQGATSNSLNMVLAGGVASGDGKGGNFTNNNGAIKSQISASGVESNYIIWEV